MMKEDSGQLTSTDYDEKKVNVKVQENVNKNSLGRKGADEKK